MTTNSRRSSVWQWGWARFPEILFVVVTTVSGLWAGGRWMDPVGDPGFSWSLGYRLSHGERLYRDVYVAYGPLSPYLLALWARLIGTSSLSMIFINWIPAILAGLLLIRCARRFLQPLERICLVGMVLATSVFVPGPGRLVLPYYAGVVHALVFGIAALLLLEPERRLRAAPGIAGMLAGLAFCSKQEVGAAALAALMASTLAQSNRRIRRAAAALLGFSVVLLVAAAFVAFSAPFESLRDRSHLWPLQFRSPAQFDLLFQSVSGLADPDWFASARFAAWKLLGAVGLLAVLGGLLARERSRAAWSRVVWLGLGLAVWGALERFSLGTRAAPVRLSVLVSFLVAILALLNPRLEGRCFLIGVGCFAGLTGLRAFVSPFLSGPYDAPAHFAAALSWAFLLFFFVPTLVWPVGRAAMLTRKALACFLLLLFWWDAAAGAESLRFPWKTQVATPRGNIYVEPGQASFLDAVGRNLTPGEKVLVFPEINAVDALFQVRSVSPLLHYLPGWVDSRTESELIRRFDKDPPSSVILFQRSTSEFGTAPFGQGFGVALWDWCLRHYRVVVSSQRGVILRLREDRGRQRGVISPGALP
jgi:hypothetical protein